MISATQLELGVIIKYLPCTWLPLITAIWQVKKEKEIENGYREKTLPAGYTTLLYRLERCDFSNLIQL